ERITARIPTAIATLLRAPRPADRVGVDKCREIAHGPADRRQRAPRRARLQDDAIHDQLTAGAIEAGVDARDDAIPEQERHRPVAARAQLHRRVDLDAVAVSEKVLGAGAIHDEA